MNQREALETLAEHVSDHLVVSGIGTQTQLWHSVLHRPGNFYLSGPMGQAVPFGLGLALARPSRRVIAVEGDGSLLMNLGILASAAQHRPANLVVLVMDNQAYELTGRQPMVNRGRTDFCQIARGFGIAETHEAARPAELSEAVRKALSARAFSFIWARLELMGEKAPPFPYYPYQIKHRFWEHVRGLDS
ncbi:MAG: sulfopyruvate decarboxylase subunit beta [Candidatus Tectomicrobia bacterium]|nr:sulfopyruvate decarboxylase subunit beta [Candidatus Tectomicrobia bacterium]